MMAMIPLLLTVGIPAYLAVMLGTMPFDRPAQAASSKLACLHRINAFVVELERRQQIIEETDLSRWSDDGGKTP